MEPASEAEGRWSYAAVDRKGVTSAHPLACGVPACFPAFLQELVQGALPFLMQETRGFSQRRTE